MRQREPGSGAARNTTGTGTHEAGSPRDPRLIHIVHSYAVDPRETVSESLRIIDACLCRRRRPPGAAEISSVIETFFVRADLTTTCIRPITPCAVRDHRQGGPYSQRRLDRVTDM